MRYIPQKIKLFMIQLTGAHPGQLRSVFQFQNNRKSETRLNLFSQPANKTNIHQKPMSENTNARQARAAVPAREHHAQRPGAAAAVRQHAGRATAARRSNRRQTGLPLLVCRTRCRRRTRRCRHCCRAHNRRRRRRTLDRASPCCCCAIYGGCVAAVCLPTA